MQYYVHLMYMNLRHWSTFDGEMSARNVCEHFPISNACMRGLSMIISLEKPAKILRRKCGRHVLEAELSPSSPLPAATGPLLSVPASPLFTGFCSGIASHGFQCNGNSLKKKLGPVSQVFFIAAIRSIL